MEVNRSTTKSVEDVLRVVELDLSRRVMYAYAPAAACIGSELDLYVMSFLVSNRI
jgi:hypothetical protein